MYSGLKPGNCPTPTLRFSGGNGECVTCGRKTHFVSLDFMEWMCGEECLALWWQRYADLKEAEHTAMLKRRGMLPKKRGRKKASGTSGAAREGSREGNRESSREGPAEE